MSPTTVSARRRGGSASRNHGTSDSGSTSLPPSESMMKLYSSDWTELAGNTQQQGEMLDLFRSKKAEFEQQSLQRGNLSDDDLRQMCALYRHQYQHQLSTIQELQKDYKDVKAKVKKLVENNHIFSQQHQYQCLTNEITQNLFNTKVMYSIFRRTPFAASVVSHPRLCSLPDYILYFVIVLSSDILYKVSVVCQTPIYQSDTGDQQHHHTCSQRTRG